MNIQPARQQITLKIRENEGEINSAQYSPLINTTAINKNTREATPFPCISPQKGFVEDPV